MTNKSSPVAMVGQKGSNKPSTKRSVRIHDKLGWVSGGVKEEEGMRRIVGDKEGILSPKGIRIWVLFGILFQVMVECSSGEWLEKVRG